MPKVTYIYGLFDPRIPDVIWYVGKSNNPHIRFQYHKKAARKENNNSPVQKWFRRLQAEDSEPRFRILETCPFSEWKERERAMISLHRKKNLLLLNVWDGGNGADVKGQKEFCECGEKRVQLYPTDTLRCPICRKAERKEYETKWKLDRPDYMPTYLRSYYQQNKDQWPKYQPTPEKKETDRNYYLANQEKLIARSAERYRRISMMLRYSAT